MNDILIDLFKWQRDVLSEYVDSEYSKYSNIKTSELKQILPQVESRLGRFKIGSKNHSRLSPFAAWLKECLAKSELKQ